MGSVVFSIHTKYRPDVPSILGEEEGFGLLGHRPAGDYGTQVVLPEGEDQFVRDFNWKRSHPGEGRINIFVGLRPSECRQYISAEERARAYIKAMAQQPDIGQLVLAVEPDNFLYGTKQMYGLISFVPELKEFFPTFPWDVLEESKGEPFYHTYLETGVEDTHGDEVAVYWMATFAQHLADDFDGIACGIKNVPQLENIERRKKRFTLL